MHTQSISAHASSAPVPALLEKRRQMTPHSPSSRTLARLASARLAYTLHTRTFPEEVDTLRYMIGTAGDQHNTIHTICHNTAQHIIIPF